MTDAPKATERRMVVRPVRVHQLCQCGKGEFLPTGIVLTSYPAQYPHVCNAAGCGNTITFYSTFPTIEYEAVDIASGATP